MTGFQKRRGAAGWIVFAALASALAGCGLRRDPPPIDISQDARILREVEARLSEDPALDSAIFRVTVQGAIVTLYGSVEGIDAWNCAILHAQLVPGVLSVVEYLTIERGPDAAACGARRPGELSLARIVPPPAPHG